MRMPGKPFWIPLLLLALWFGGRAWYFSPNVTEAETAKDFTALRPDGQTFSLSDLRGGYVLLDFWGSWCGPCRAESPALVALHKRMGDRLTIVSIAVERDSAAWTRARTRDAKDWAYQVMDQTGSLRFPDGEISDLYGVNAVPRNFLIGPKGVVLGVDIDPSQIAERLKVR